MSFEQTRIDQNRHALANYLFSDRFCMSRDLQFIILDFVFDRCSAELHHVTPKNNKYCIRLGVVFSEDKVLGKTYLSMDYKRLFYEIQIYDEVCSYSICSYHIDCELRAIEHYEKFKNLMINDNTADVTKIVLSVPSILNYGFFRYVYSPNENSMYRICAIFKSGKTTFSVSEVNSKTADEEVIIWQSEIKNDDPKNAFPAVYLLTRIFELIQQRSTDNIKKRLNKFMPKSDSLSLYLNALEN